MNRREILQGSAAFSIAAVAGMARAASKPAKERGHEAMHHHDSGPGYGELAHAATHCVMFGEACIDHCLTLLGEGDKEMAACAKSVEHMMSACTMLRQLATWKSSYVPRMAAVVMDMCKACEDECRKHEKKHKSCKDCADSCAACYTECKKVAA